MKRIITLLAAAALLSSLPGCCCLWPHGNPCSPCNPCNTGCGVGGQSVYVPQSTHQSYDAVTGVPVPTTTAYQPVMTAPALSLGPLEALPTYR